MNLLLWPYFQIWLNAVTLSQNWWYIWNKLLEIRSLLTVEYLINKYQKNKTNVENGYFLWVSLQVLKCYF